MSSPSLQGITSLSDVSSVPDSPKSSLSAPSLQARTPSHSSTSSGPAEQRYASFKELVSGGEGSRTLGAASTGLEALRDIFEATSTVPMVKYLAGVGIQLLQYVIDMQIANDTYGNLALRAKDVIVAVAQSCKGLQASMAPQLESDLRQLTDSMDAILAFAVERTSRGTLKKLWNKSEDVASVKALDVQLTHSFVLFLIQSNVVSRRQQDEMIKRLADLSVSSASPLPELITDCPLRVEEGVYLVQNAASGKILEIEDFKTYGAFEPVHVFLTDRPERPSQTQLWSVRRNAFKDFEYNIVNLSTGYVLNINGNSDRDGAKVIGYPWKPADGNSKWAFWGTRKGTHGDYCTIRSTGLPTILDGACPNAKNKPNCIDSHATRLTSAGPSFSQEWQLISMSTSTRPDSGTELPNAASTPSRRRLLLQNVQTGFFASRVDKPEPGSNVVLTSTALPSSAWSFMYINTIRRDRFAILNCSQPFSLAQHAGKSIYVGLYRPEGPFHKWTAHARDGAFILRNAETNMLLAARSGAVDVLPRSARDDPACHWRLIDAQTNEHVRILCDSTLTVVPSELAGPAPDLSEHYAKPLVMRTVPAPLKMQNALVDSFGREHATIRAMLEEGYSAIVCAPRTIAGWRNGETKTVKIEDDDVEFKWVSADIQPCS
ncbi:unnamed protein product [Peniophora sp. CBMAI 1063]|nr:unnamed protein product [Peniophora sp. CBMAI 1063]